MSNRIPVPKGTKDLADLAASLVAETPKDDQEPSPSVPGSPAWSASGNPRNLKQMKPEKFAIERQAFIAGGFEKTDPIGAKAFAEEQERREKL